MAGRVRILYSTRTPVNRFRGAMTGFDALPRPGLTLLVYSSRTGMRMPKNSTATEPAVAAPFDFEAAMSELEAVVTRLESGDVPLEEALGAFERGVALTRACQTALSAAEQKVEKLSMHADGTAHLEPFDGDDD